MKNFSYLLLSAFIATSAFAGTRNVVLQCGEILGIEDGESYTGSFDRIQISMSTDKDTEIKILKRGPRGAELPSIGTSRPDGFSDLYTGTNGQRVYLYRDSNCLKGNISAVVLSQQTISNCTRVSSDVMEGSDKEYCD